MMMHLSEQLDGAPQSHLPPSIYGESKGNAKLLTVNRKTGTISSDKVSNLHEYLGVGDLLVVNNSKVVKGQLSAYFHGPGEYGYIHVGTSRNGGMVLVEPRPKALNRKLEDSSEVTIVGAGLNIRLERRNEIYGRYWWADFGASETKIQRLMKNYGRPITYDHVSFPFPEEYYNTIFSKVPGSVEPPSAGFQFTDDIIEKLNAKGVELAEITLHCNLGSLEQSEFEKEDRLLSEEYKIPISTLRKINNVKRRGGRIIALGTTVVRALESHFSQEPMLIAESGALTGRTDIFIKRGFKFHSVDALITGMHDGQSSHLDMISALIGPELLGTAYSLAVEWGYLWHEFGDLTLIT